MFRILIIAAVSLALLAPAWGDKGEDIEQVRKILQKEQDGWRKGDQEMVLSCFAPDFVGYAGWWGRLDLISVTHVGLDSLRANYVSTKRLEQEVTNFSRPGSVHPFEVLHIDVKGDHAIGLTNHVSVVPDKEERETIINKFRSVWMLKKIKGEWKITSFISGVYGEQNVYEQGPE